MRLSLFVAACFVATGFVTMSASLAHAQYYGGWGGPRYGGYVGGASTAYAPGVNAHGFADVVRSAGVYNVLTSEAYKNLEDARKKNIENRLQWTKTYFEMRRINRAARKAEWEEIYGKKGMEDFARYAQLAAPKRLASTQLDPITGYVAWPRLLLTDRYKGLRREVDKLFAERANAQGAIGNDAYFQILEKTNQMKAMLKQTIRGVPPHDYLESRKFLDSLAYEARHAAG